MNRISTSILLLLALGLSVVGTAACAADADEEQNEPAETTSDITQIDESVAHTKESPRPVDPTSAITEHSSLVGCETCGPLPDPWAKGPLPDPWKSTSSTSGASTPTPHK